MKENGKGPEERKCMGASGDREEAVTARPTSRRGFIKASMAAGFGMLIINPFRAATPLRCDEGACGHPIPGDPADRVYVDEYCGHLKAPDFDCGHLTSSNPSFLYSDERCAKRVHRTLSMGYFIDMACHLAPSSGVEEPGHDADCGYLDEMFSHNKDDYCGRVYGGDKIEADESCNLDILPGVVHSDESCGHPKPDSNALYSDEDCGGAAAGVGPGYPPSEYHTDSICARQVPASEPAVHYGDGCCARPLDGTAPDSGVHGDDDCGLATPVGGLYSDEDCTRPMNEDAVHTDDNPD